MSGLCGGASLRAGQARAGAAGWRGRLGRVRVTCTEPVEGGGRLDLAAAGANARRAIEDSTAVAYIEAPGPAIPFTRPILDEAEVALIVGRSGASGMATILDASRSRGDLANLCAKRSGTG